MSRYQELLRLIGTETNECVIWPHAVDTGGYPHLKHRGRVVHGHRESLTLMVGPSDGQQVRHLCPGKANRRCVNHRHLLWGSHDQNMVDKLGLHGTAQKKLTPAAARDIVALRGVVTQQVLADRYGVSPATIIEVQIGKTWSWATGITERPAKLSNAGPQKGGTR